MTIKFYDKYKFMRDLSLISICGNLTFNIFPFPPMVWRSILIFLALIAIKDRLHKLLIFEKAIILFWALNIVYFFTSYFWIDNPKIGDIGNITCTLLSIPLFVTLGKNNVMTFRFYSYSILLIMICAYIYYINMERFILSSIGTDIMGITNNASGIFLFILPFVFCIKNRYLQYVITIVCLFFLISAVKRGNLICAIPVLCIYIYSTFKNNTIKTKEKLIFLLFILLSSFWVINKTSNNDYFQKRLNDTLEGNTSNRDYIYARCWNLWSNSLSGHNIFFGYGFNECSINPQVGYYAHSDWLEVLVDYGLLGIFTYMAIFITFILFYKKMHIDYHKKLVVSIVLVWFLKSIFSMGFTTSFMCIMFMTLGIIFGTNNNNSIHDT